MSRILLAFILLTLPSAEVQPADDDLSMRLEARVPEYTLSGSGVVDALARAACRFHIPMGIEWVRDAHSSNDFQQTWKDETVGNILTSIAAAYPSYTLRVEGGVVHVFRQDLLKDKHNFLNLKVPDFFETRQEVAGLTNQRLLGTIQHIVSSRYYPPGAGEAGSYTGGNVPEEPLSIKLRGLTVREALERLVATSEHHLWIVTFTDDSRLTATGFLRTETTWHPAPFPNADQPMWDFLAWSQYLASFPAPARH